MFDKGHRPRCTLRVMAVTVIFVGAAVLTLTIWEILYRKYTHKLKLKGQIFIAAGLVLLFVLLVLGGFITFIATQCGNGADCA